MKIDSTKKQNLIKRFNAVKTEASNWTASWKDLRDYLNPTRGKFDDDRANRGTMIDHTKILDSHGTKATKILASGMQSGMTSPTRPWFKLAVDDEYLMSLQPVRVWLDEVTKLMLDICNDSNIYGMFYSMYEEIADFGTAAAIILEDFEDGVRGRNFTIGEYFLGTDNKGRVNTFARNYWMTADQMIEEFGRDNCSHIVKNAVDTNDGGRWIRVYHMIEPNKKREAEKVDYANMPFSSIYWEDNQGDEVLAKKGFEEFPVIAPRWDTVTTETVYGYSPGWNALGDVKQLQKTQLDKLLAQEKSHNPPMQKDASVDGHTNFLPGGITTTSATTPNGGVRPAYQINANLESFIELINSLRTSINKDFFVDLFLMMINFDKSNMTATEVAERQQEKIMMMGPVLEKLNSEMLDPFIERLYNILDRNFALPEPPDELDGIDVKVQYVSILAQAQKAIGVNAISRVIGFIGGVIPSKQDVSDVIDLDEAVREVAVMEGIPSKLIMEKQVVSQIREQRAKAQQMQERLAVADKGADIAKKLSSAKTGEENLLTDMAGMVQQ